VEVIDQKKSSSHKSREKTSSKNTQSFRKKKATKQFVQHDFPAGLPTEMMKFSILGGRGILKCLAKTGKKAIRY